MAIETLNPAFTLVASGTIAQHELIMQHTDGTARVTTANAIAIGISTDDVVSGEQAGVRSFSAGGRLKVKAKGDGVNIAINDILVAGASGKALKLPAGAGTYYQIGIAAEACTADGDIITVIPIGAGTRIVVP